MQKIEILSAAGFPAAVRSGVVLVDFSRRNCSGSAAVSRVIDLLANDDGFPDAVRIARVHVDAAPLIAAKFRVETAPTLILFRNGVEVRRHCGAADEACLLALVE
ncbi:MAG: thioredoxin family protein [Lentisphaeria bacterium]|nr:thioredoxin family protein [Lentisphaeria bacterium]